MAAAEGALQGGPAPAQQGGPSEASEYDSELFKRDEFRLWCMKVIPCTKRFVHDWTICPFAHAGEKAVRRDPRLHSYTGIACPDMKKTGTCIRAEKCPYAHNVFEYWLHPTRYRTQLCNDGPMCRRGICFFAHSLEELRVPACKPYVSPEALARASLEAIQQNPHPLGQQLANPVAAAQQQAAMAALSRPRGGGREALPGGGGGPAFAPVAQGGYRPSGEPARYSAPSPGLLAGSGSGELGPGGDYMAGQATSYGGPRWSHPGHVAGSFQGPPGTQPGGHGAQHGGPQYGFPQQYSGPYPDGGQRRSDSAMRYSDGGQRYSGNHRFSGGQQAGAQRYSGGYGGAGRLSGNRGGGGSTGSFGAGGEQEGGGARRKPPPPAAPQAQAYPSAPARAPSPAGQASQQGAPRSFAAVQHPPPQGFGSFVAGGGGEGASARSVGAPGSVPSVRTSSSHSDDEAAAPNSGSSPRGSSPAVEHGLAESLASLKIAMTQQQLAAAAGSNHEVVITTLHQILKDAMAQQGGGPTPSSSFGAAGGEPGPSLPPGMQAPAASSGQRWSSGSPDASAGLSYSSSMPTVASGMQFPSPQTSADAAAAAAVAAVAAAAAAAGLEVDGNGAPPPPPAASQATAACFQAALTAAAGGYPGVMPMAAPALRAGSASLPVDDSVDGGL